MTEQKRRSFLEEREDAWLSPHAAKAASSKGREREEESVEYRTAFQRDRDRIIHCKTFRRLMHKTQVFLSPEGDHYRTRMTHTLEVMQIARSVARALRLNEDLCEAISLGHDLGHTPFGHSGERVLQNCYDPNFTHGAQSLRVVEVLERGRRGLNLTWEVRDGIAKHTGGDMAATHEGVIVKFADRIAYINHDIDDAVSAGVISEDDVPMELRKTLGMTSRARIDTMVNSLIETCLPEFLDPDATPSIRMDKEIGDAMHELRKFMFQNVYANPVAKRDEGKAMALLEELYYHFIAHPEQLPNEYRNEDEDVARRVCDYVAGMTDRYAIRTYTELRVPKMFK